ncbi:Bax inhibitor-1 family protein [Natronomonas salina]|uniref:Bax inhibitor-1 family protein n=1 Tax=Natronomonas salina TaxID=1710540 RepID=UPI0015B7428D|nr:Bax inhibitor-1 family protein [Natronomonas salina]QLD88343.1 Bax inhibitor-1 family protein [Natronomonas salina]
MAQTYSSRTRTAHPKFRNVAVPAAILIAVNVALMFLVAQTPLAAVNDLLFSTPILGLIVFGAALTGGNVLAERGLERGQVAVAGVGIVLLQGAYAVFGGGILARVPQASQGVALGVTLVVTVAMTIAVAGYVYVRDRDFDHWNKWALGAFVIGAVLVLVGSFVTDLALLGGFLFIFLGFMFRLGYEIWRVRASYDPDRSLIHALGIYVAFTGVFVHVLQIVARMMADR